jgi:NAD-dependent histone deacetylase SIR2
VFDIGFFRNNPRPFYALARELYPGRYRPTIAHSFIRLLYEKGRLLKLFTQNVDCLEREAGVPGEVIVDAHGSFASQHCIDCKSYYPHDLMKQAVEKGEIPHCITPQCNGLIKPDIVFFGEALPEEFFLNRQLPAAADLCIIMGTSLSVQPFAGLPSFCRDETPRLLINLEQVGGLGSRADDVLLLGDCDEGVRKLAKALGWQDELEALWEQTNPDKKKREEETAPLQTRDEKLKEEVDRLTDEVDRTLNLTTVHQDRVREQLANQDAKRQTVEEAEVGETSRGTCGVVSAGAQRGEELPAKGDQDKILREGVDSGGGGLAHVFPHLTRKSSL